MRISAVRLCLLLTICALFSANALAQEQDPFGNEATQTDPFAAKANAATKSPTRTKRIRQARVEAVPKTDDQIRDKLKAPADLVYDQEPFSIVIDRLTGSLKVNMFVDSSLAGQLDGDTLVSSNLVGVEMGAGLRMLLKPLEATWVAKGGAIVVIPLAKEHDAEFLVRRFIDVEELLEQAKQRAQRSGAMGGMMGMGGMGPARAVNYPASTELQSVIEQMVSPQSWNENGNCRTVVFNETLIVLGSERVNEEVKSLIDELRRQSQD